MNADGTNPRQLTSGWTDEWARFSPDGTQIVFNRCCQGQNPPGQWAIYTMTAAATNIQDISNPPPPPNGVCPCDQFPDWAPDGTDVVFGRDSEISTIKSDGSSPTPTPLASGGFPAYSPQGSQIAFDRNGSLWVMNSDGTNQHLVATGMGQAEPAWQPLPRAPGTLAAQFIVPSVMSTASSPSDPYSVSWAQGTCPSEATYTVQESVKARRRAPSSRLQLCQRP